MDDTAPFTIVKMIPSPIGKREKRLCGRPRQLARPIHYKQAGAVEEALRRRGVIANVQPN